MITMNEINAIVKFVSCKIAYEVAQHENCLHDDGESTPVAERKALEESKRELREMINGE